MVSDARSFRRREKSTRQNLRFKRRSAPPSRRHQRSSRNSRRMQRRHRHSRQTQITRRRRLERSPPPSNANNPSHLNRRRRNPLLPTSIRNRRRRPLLSTNLRKSRNHIRQREASRDNRCRHSENNLHPHSNIPPRQNRPTTVASKQRRRNDNLTRHTRILFNNDRSFGEEAAMGRRFINHNGFILRGVFLNRDGSHHVGLQLGDISVEATRARDEYGSSGE